MVQAIQAVRGMNDILPQSSPYWQLLEDACRRIAKKYSYHEIRFPIVEKTGLFQRTIGQATDIVEKEMYTFEDRNGDSLTLRPEGTAGCVRACIQNGILHQRMQRLWYLGPMFRHERPQKGRTRQFHQFGIEAFGMQGPDIDVEQLLLFKQLLEELDLLDSVKLELNSLGTKAARHTYREALVDYLNQHIDALDEDSQRRLITNPLRILDSKNPKMQALIEAAPKMIDYLDDASKKHFDECCELLTAVGLDYVINPRLVRGLDYYGLTVYEWVTDALGAQGTVCAGGHYDTLVEELGGKSTPAVGFAMGCERMVLLLEKVRTCQQVPHVSMILVGDDAVQAGLKLADYLRRALPWITVECNLSAGSFKSQFKRADKSGAKWALILGEEEVAQQMISIKNLREEQPQQQMNREQLLTFLQQRSAT